jgi:two-component system, cell cycle sensor histidine kinase and response regulator CckA
VQPARRLLTFSRGEPARVALLDLDDVVRGLESMLTTLIGSRAEVEWDFEPGSKSVRADVGQLEQVLMHLLVNARDALPAGGRIAISTRTSEVTSGDATGLDAGRYATLSVTETGVGVEPVNLERIFEPFSTTKEPERRTGLAPATPYGIVQAAGGTITVDSEQGQGATFTVYLPCVEDTAERAQADAAEPRPPAARVDTSPARVMLVEDDEAMLRLGEIVLSEAGYAVRAAQSGHEAVELLRQDPRLDLLVTDVSMPVMSGKELATAVRALVPDVPVLFMTGYDHATLGARTGDGGRSEVIQKPFGIVDLRAKAARLLAERASSP